MATDIFPAGVNSQGATTWIFTPTSPIEGTGEERGISLAVLQAATAADLTCYLPASEQEIGFDQERNDDTRACDDNKREEFGAASFTRESIFHIVAPQGEADDAGNLAVGALPPWDTVFATVIMGIPRKTGTPLDEGNLGDVYEVTTGEEHITPRENGKYRREVKTSFTRIGRSLPLITGSGTSPD